MPAASPDGVHTPDPVVGLSQPPARELSRKKMLWPLLLSLLVLTIIGYFTFEPASFREAVRTLSPWWLAAAVATIAFRLFFGAWRFLFVARGKLTFAQALRGQLAWDFFSNVAPATIGGGPFAAVYVARDASIKVGETTALVLFTMLLDQIWAALMVPVILLSASFMEVIPASVGAVGTLAILAYFAIMLSWIALFGYATLFRPEWIEQIGKRIFRFRLLRRFQDRVAGETARLSQASRILRSQPPAFFFKSFMLTAGTWIPRYLLPVFILLAVYPLLDELLFLLRAISMMVLSMIIPTPGGAGGIEGLYALFLGPLMPAALLAPTLLMWRFLGFYLFVSLGAFLYKGRRTQTSYPATNPAPTLASHSLPARPTEVVNDLE